MKTLKLLAIPLILLGVLFYAVHLLHQSTQPDTSADSLVIFAAAGLRAPLDDVLDEYRAWWRANRGTAPRIEVQYSGTGDLLARLQAGATADLVLVADSDFLDIARRENLIREALPLAVMRPVIALSKNGVGLVENASDLATPGVSVGIGHPEGTAIGRVTRDAWTQAGIWDEVSDNSAVTKTTVNELAMDLQIGALDAAVIWDFLARQFGLGYINDPFLDEEATLVSIAVTRSTEQSPAALHLARFLSAPEKGAQQLAAHGLEVVPGDRWADRPELTVFSGAINRNALGKVIDGFIAREGVRMNTTYNGCGVLTSQMKLLGEQTHEAGFPDLYIACDVYYMEPVEDHFVNQRAVSGTDIVIVTPKGNPKNIQTLDDLTKPGVRLVVGNPEFCTIGALVQRLFEYEGMRERVEPNIVERTTSSALLVPAVVTGSADAVLAYKTDTYAEADRLEVIAVDSEYAKAVQPFGASRLTPYPLLTERFYQFLSEQAEAYEGYGFNWLFGEELDQYSVTPPGGARR